MTEAEYFREANLLADLPIPADVAAEHEKINSCDAIVFIDPLFWLDVPAKLKGWFDRVWTYGFAYGENRTMKTLEKGLVICIAGNTIENLSKRGEIDSIKTSMLGDRLHDRVKSAELLILDGTGQHDENLRTANWEKHLRTIYNKGLSLNKQNP
jgi:NAD(P)H dehydrogenase (quinone)